MNRLRAFFILLGSSIIALPLGAHAADIPLLSPGWSIVPEVCRACPCGFAGVLAIVQNLMNTGIGFAILFSVIIMTWAGVLYITTPANPEARGKANNMLINAVVGILIVLSAWLIVDFVMKILYNPNNAGWGPWNTILGDSTGESCTQAATVQPLFSGSIAVTLPEIVNTPAGAGNYQAGGKCTVQASGACAASNLSVFGSAAQEASQVCFGESSGSASVVNSSAKLPDGTPYVFGLFQINITANPVGGNDCPSAFSKKSCTVKSCGAGSGVKVVNAALYNKCVAAAKDAAQNIAAAHDIYLGAHATWKPWDAAKACGLAHVPGLAPVLAIMNICRPERS